MSNTDILKGNIATCKATATECERFLVTTANAPVAQLTKKAKEMMEAINTANVLANILAVMEAQKTIITNPDAGKIVSLT